MERTNFDPWKHVCEMTIRSDDFVVMFTSVKEDNELDPRMVKGTAVLVPCDRGLAMGHEDMYIRGKVKYCRFRPLIGVKVFVEMEIHQEYIPIHLHDLRLIYESGSLKVIETFSADANPNLMLEVYITDNVRKQLLVPCSKLFHRGHPDIFVKGDILTELTYPYYDEHSIRGVPKLFFKRENMEELTIDDVNDKRVLVSFEFYAIRHIFKSSDIKWL